MKTVVVMDGRGQLTMPEPIREALHLENGDGLELELEFVVHAVVLRPTAVSPEEDIWAYTPEYAERLQRARERPQDEDLRLSPAEFERLVFGSSE